MSDPDFDQMALDVGARAGRGDILPHIKEALRQVWNARGATDAVQLEASLAAQHDEIWEGVKTHWVRKEDVEDLSVRAHEAEARVAELTAELRALRSLDR